MKNSQVSVRRVGRRMQFTALFPQEPTDKEVWDAQVDAGYHPFGYGGPNSITRQQTDAGWTATWDCFDSCD